MSPELRVDMFASAKGLATGWRPGYWYLATPYTRYPAGRAAACWKAASIAGALLKAGVHVFCPIAHGHPMSVHGGVPYDDLLWLTLDEHFMVGAIGLLVAHEMEGWETSFGVQHEIKRFEELHKPIFYLRSEPAPPPAPGTCAI